MTQATLPKPENDVAGVIGSDCYAKTLLLSMENVTLLDTAAIGYLVKKHKNFQDQGGQLVVHSLRPDADHMIRLLRLDKFLHLAPDEATARDVARKGQP